MAKRYIPKAEPTTSREEYKKGEFKTVRPSRRREEVEGTLYGRYFEFYINSGKLHATGGSGATLNDVSVVELTARAIDHLIDTWAESGRKGFVGYEFNREMVARKYSKGQYTYWAEIDLFVTG